MEEYEEATELLEPFHEVEIPKKRTYFNLNINKRKKIIKENSDKLKEKKRYYDKKKYMKLLEIMKNSKDNKKDNLSANNLDINFTDIFSKVYNNKFILKNKKSNQNLLTEENLLQKRIPENLLGYIDPYEISLITNSNLTKKKLKLKNKSNNQLSSNQKEYFPTDISSNNNNNFEYDNNNYYYNFSNDYNIDGVDFKLISSINQEQKKLTKKLQKLNPEMKNDIKIRNSERKLRPKSSLYTFPRYYYIPNTSNYKHINVKKEEIFNNKFYSKKKKDNSTFASRLHQIKGMTQKDFYNPTEIYLSNNKEENLIKKKSNRIKRNLNIIKKTLISDKNNTHRCIESVKNKRIKKENLNELYLRNEFKKEVFITTEFDTHGAIEKVVLNPFGKLKRVISIKNHKGEDLISSILASTVAKFCKKENFEVFLRNKGYRDFTNKLKKQEEERKRRKERKKITEENDFLIFKLEKNLIKKKNELIEKYSKP